MLWDMDWERQEKMGPSKERSNYGQRTFLSLMLIGVVVFGVHFESDCNGSCLESVKFCFPIAPEDIWGLLYIINDLSAFSDRSLHS